MSRLLFWQSVGGKSHYSKSCLRETAFEMCTTYQNRLACREKEDDAHSAVEEANRMFYVAFEQTDLKVNPESLLLCSMQSTATEE